MPIILSAVFILLPSCSSENFYQGSGSQTPSPRYVPVVETALSPPSDFEISFAKPEVAGVSNEVSNSSYDLPVQGEITDFFRPPAHIGAQGNRGWEYTTLIGSQVKAAQSGVVHFAGQVAGNFYVSILHPDGIKTTYSFVSDIQVSKSEAVQKGQLIALTTDRPFHFGVVKNDDYIDPVLLFDCQDESCFKQDQGDIMKVRLIPMAA